MAASFLFPCKSIDVLFSEGFRCGLPRALPRFISALREVLFDLFYTAILEISFLVLVS